jgi:hypothetical protein
MSYCVGSTPGGILVLLVGDLQSNFQKLTMLVGSD